MYLAMNRFWVATDKADIFEKTWRERDSYLDEVPGFESFALLRGPEDGDKVLYSSHTVWKDHAAFEAWKGSEAFRKAHAGARMPKGVVLSHPQFEGFEKIL